MDIVATTKAEANAHLEKLRRERGIRRDQLRDSALVSSLDQALNILSDQLYQASTHFILELIQNADDNSYASGTIPSLHLSLYDSDDQGHFRSDCNEVGFTLKQLDALARVGQSTKISTVDGTKGYIGEKGIGFKSVFKVANVVHVSSGCYEFKFNRDEPIGMILPIPSRFPVADRVADHTQFLLELKDTSDYDDIFLQLKEIEPDLLLFLRKLDRIRISTDGVSKIYRRKITKLNLDYGGETATISSRGDTVAKRNYVVHRHTAQELPPDPRREGIASSEVIIAFLIKGEATPSRKTQKVFAFLPIDDYGFRFLIHADFILVASRESLDYSCLWNRRLRDEIENAFVDAMRRFVALPATGDGKGLRYKWPKYLSRHSTGSQFWNDLHRGILKALRRKPLLESRDGSSLRKPTDLYYIPEAYRFEDQTLFDLSSINNSHLSFDYDDVWQDLCLIGVRVLDLDDLCDEFRLWIDEVGVAGVKSQSIKWHRKIGSVFCDSDSLLAELRNLPIVPLRDGSWVKASQDGVYFASTDEAEYVPNDVDLSIVDRRVSQDSKRRNFLEFLGIREYSPVQVCELILKLHETLSDGSSSRRDKDLVADAVYLFNHRLKLRSHGAPKILFTTRRDGKTVRILSGDIYLIDSAVKPGLIAQYRNTTGSPLAVLAEEYEAAVCKHGLSGTIRRFHQWLLGSEHTTFSTVPRLLRNNKLSKEWLFLRKKSVLDLLQAIRLHKDKSGSLSPYILKAAAELKVPRLDGTFKLLADLALPTTELKQKCPNIDFASLPDPTLENWGFLSAFGVVTTCNTTARLRELQQLGQLPVDEVDRSAVYEIYQALDSSRSSDWEEIQTAFRQTPLVFVFKPKRKWLTHSFCVWTAPDPLKEVVKLRSRYPKCKKLFRSILGVGNATTEHVVDELCSLPDGGDRALQRFEDLFSLLGLYDADHAELSREQVRRIQHAMVFPVVDLENGTHSKPTNSYRSLHDGNWYVPDKAILERAFRGKVTMLDLPVRVVRVLQGLFKSLDYDHMFLSSAVEESTETRGTSIRDMRFESNFKIRLKYLSQLSENDWEACQESMMPKIWSVPFISIKRHIGMVEATEDGSLITIKEDEGVTNIYIQENISMSDQPRVIYELVEYVMSLLNIDANRTNLVNYLMSTSIAEIPEILEQHDVSLPEDSDDESVDTESSHNESSDSEENDTNAVHRITAPIFDDLGLEPTNDNRSDSRLSDLERRIASLDMSSEAENSHTVLASSPGSTHPHPLRELIPSHQERTERIAQRARHFRIPESLVARAPIQSPQSNTVSHPPLARRTRNTHSNGGGVPSPDDPALELSSSEEVTGMHTNFLARSYHRSEQIPPSPSQVPRRSQLERAPVSEIRHREIGFLGELFVYKMIQPHIEDWSYENWTSKLRVEAGHPRFTEREKDFSDFTYLDRFGHMKEVLREVGMDVNAEWSPTTTFHLEVKATLGHCSEALFVSQNQLDKMRHYDSDVNHAFVLLRVFDLDEGGNPNVKFFRDPWSLYVNGVLDFRSDHGYKVYELT